MKKIDIADWKEFQIGELFNIEKGTKRVDYAKIKSDVRDSLGKYLYQEIGSKPMIITVIQEV